MRRLLPALLLLIFATGCIRDTDKQMAGYGRLFARHVRDNGLPPGSDVAEAAVEVADQLGVRLGPPKVPVKLDPVAMRATVKQSRAEDQARDYFLGLTKAATGWLAGLGIPGVGAALAAGAWLLKKKRQAEQLAELATAKGHALMGGFNAAKQKVADLVGGDQPVTVEAVTDAAKEVFTAAGVGAELYADYKSGKWKEVELTMPNGGKRTAVIAS